jgi:twitching motility protein PilT
MNNTAQDNTTNLSYPTFNDGANPQPTNSAPNDDAKTQIQNDDANYGNLKGQIDTIPTGMIPDDLNDIMPDLKKPKALERTPKSNNLAEPMGGGKAEGNDYLVPQEQVQQPVVQKEEITENSQPIEKDEGEKIEVVDLGDTPLPQEEISEDVSMPDIQNNSSNPQPPNDEVLDTVADKSNGNFYNKEVNASVNNKQKIDALLEYAIEKGASDLHISVGYPPIVRIDGELEEVNDQIIDSAGSEELILPLISDDKRELLEVNKEIDFAYTFEGKYTGRFRINAFYAMKNLSAAFRLIPGRVRTLEELKLPQIYHQFAKLKQGMILVTGPTGHGKSTTIASMLEDINRTRFSRIITIEDPVEYVFEGKKALIDQREMSEDTHSWPIALKSAMRQDPDVILVGEMRDYETISAAITLAETGHLVFATLHTNNASQSIDRMIDVFPDEQQTQIRAQLSNILEVVIAQRLIPLDHGGRRAVSEILIVNPAIKNLIREHKSHQVDNVIRTSSDIGMVSLERALVNLVREGVIGINTAQEYAVYPEEVSRLLKS